jgi:hypothetical protein
MKQKNINIFLIQAFIIVLFEIGILDKLIGYSDWYLYRKALLEGNEAPGFLQILNFFHTIFSSFAIIIWYILQLIINTYILKKLFLYLPKRIYFKYFILYNPFFIIFYSGIFKEVILFNIVVWVALNNNYLNKLLTLFFYTLIRIHLSPFILFLITKFSIILYIFFGLISFYFINYFNIIDYNLILGSVSEIKDQGKGDLPIMILFDSSLLPLFTNTFIIIFGFIFTTNLIIKLLYTFTVLYIIIFYFKHRLFKSMLAFIVGLLPYAFIVTNSGTALRMITFIFAVTVSYHFISKNKSLVIAK